MYSSCCLSTCILIVRPCILIVFYVFLFFMYSYFCLCILIVYVSLLMSMYDTKQTIHRATQQILEETTIRIQTTIIIHGQQ